MIRGDCMKLTLDIKNFKRIIKPTKDDVILYDGKEWYVTTKKDLFEELSRKFDEREIEVENKLSEIKNVIEEFKQIKVENAKQISTMSKTIKDLISGGLK